MDTEGEGDVNRFVHDSDWAVGTRKLVQLAQAAVARAVVLPSAHRPGCLPGPHAATCSGRREISTCCFQDVIVDVNPRPFNHTDIYQQFEIHRHYNGGFYATSVAHDGFPPKFLRRKGWEVHTSTTSFKLHLPEAQGHDTTHPMDLPELDVTLSQNRLSRVVVGKWYCPFVFVKEEGRLVNQMQKTLFYGLTLEHWWEEVYSCQNVSNEGNVVVVNASVQREVALVHGREALKDDRHGGDGFIWFRVRERCRRRGLGVALSKAIVEKIRWVQERGGWVDGGEKEVIIESVEEIRGEREWRYFGCYVLVQSFGVRRMDGSLLMRLNFRHTNKVQCKWE
ncbi:unnamed protein product [Ilex paraguariensis]|uniref:N-acetyltransferase domain-containing protein n=1 Tax=Ilex paraguariensis TaxID=185542 RepID=A0ABC8UXZ4_9AQUA